MKASTFFSEHHQAKVVMFFCPGCNETHQVPIEGPNAWRFNGKLDAPTIEPSIRRDHYLRCHSQVTGGNITFFQDCNHPMAGHTVELPSLD